MYESGDIMRDYILIESDPHTQERLRTEFQSIQNETTASLKACIQSLPTAKGSHFSISLRNWTSYWSTIESHFRIRCDGEEGTG